MCSRPPRYQHLRQWLTPVFVEVHFGVITSVVVVVVLMVVRMTVMVFARLLHLLNLPAQTMTPMQYLW
jgi:hypothetical protein